jgi:hypothetical protein
MWLQIVPSLLQVVRRFLCGCCAMWLQIVPSLLQVVRRFLCRCYAMWLQIVHRYCRLWRSINLPRGRVGVRSFVSWRLTYPRLLYGMTKPRTSLLADCTQVPFPAHGHGAPHVQLAGALHAHGKLAGAGASPPFYFIFLLCAHVIRNLMV